MLKLIQCEFWKLKRKRFVLLVVLAAFLFPLPVTAVAMTPRIMGRYDTKAEIFDALFSFIMGYGVLLLLPCVIGVLATMLFFMERDNDTFKSLTKIIVLFLMGILFSLASTFATILCGSVVAEVGGLAYKLLASVMLGIFITAGTLPLVVLVVFFSRTYIFSILLCVFYSVLSLTLEGLYSILPKELCLLFPIPLTNLWFAGNMADHGISMNLTELAHLIPSTFQTAATLSVMAILSVLLIDRLYKRRGE